MFEKTYAFIYKKDLSRHYRILRNSVTAGASKVYGPYRKYAVGLEGEVGKKRSFSEAKSRARDLIKKFPNHKVTFRAYKGDEVAGQVRFATLINKPPVAKTEGCEGIDRFVGWIEAERKKGKFKGRRYAGICVCKSTTSGSHSDHADCAAVDVFASWADMHRMVQESLSNSDWYHTKYSILGDLIYFPGLRPRDYTGNYHAHIHLSVNGGKHNSAC